MVRSGGGFHQHTRGMEFPSLSFNEGMGFCAAIAAADVVALGAVLRQTLPLGGKNWLGVGNRKSMYDCVNSFSLTMEYDGLFPQPFTYINFDM